MDYYQISHDASSEIGDHEGLLYLQHLCHHAKKVLDVGCGEGTRLFTLLRKSETGWGIDPSPQAVKKAKSQYPGLNFQVGKGESLPYQTSSFDLVYSAFAVEHSDDPEKFIREMIRVCRPGGRIVILAPNYGAPGRRSPNSTENPYNKFFEGVLKDFFPQPNLDWCQVTPRPDYKVIDADTTWEPYLHSLHLYLKSQNLKVIKCSSLWALEPKSRKFRKLVIKKLGQSGIWPFRYWGPQVFVAAQK